MIKSEGNKTLNQWDRPYYCKKLKKQKYGNSINRFRRYFEIENVVENTFKIYEELLGLKFREIPEA